MSKYVRYAICRLLVPAVLSLTICISQNTLPVYAMEQTTTADADTDSNVSENEEADTITETNPQDTLVEEVSVPRNNKVTEGCEAETDPEIKQTNDGSGENENSESEAETDSEIQSEEDIEENLTAADPIKKENKEIISESFQSEGYLNTVYVDGMNGSDESADGSMEHPYRTLSAASGALGTGGTVMVLGTITADSETSDALADISSKNGAIHRADGFGDTLLSIPSGVSVNVENIEISGEGVKASSPLVSVDSKGTLTIGSGALLTGNKNVDPDGRGGAVCNNGTLILEGGSIEGNTSAEGAGIYNTGKFTMKGGSISNNTAENPESSYYAAGGGLFCAANSDTELFSGTISGNTSINGGSMSGGGIYIDNGARVTARDLLVTGNDSGFEGGGISTCPTGRIDFRFSNSAAVFDNTSATDADDLHFEVVQNSIVKNGMLGGGTESWDPAPKSGETGETYYNAHPTASDKEQALSAARMIISGNHAEEGMGGGIRCNGTLNITASDPHNDTDSGEGNLGTKTFIKQSGDGTRLMGAIYEITDSDGSVAASVTSDDNGILDLQDIPDGTYSVRETTAPYGYAISSEIYTMEIQGEKVIVRNADGDPISAFTDEKADGVVIKLNKIGKEWLDSYAKQHNLDNPEIPLCDVEFTLTGKTAGGAEKTITGKTGIDGTLDFGFIPDGTWTLTETYPDGYSSRAKSNSSYTFTVKDGKFIQGETSGSYVSGGHAYEENNLGVDIAFSKDSDGNEKFSVTNYQLHNGKQGPPGPTNQYFKKDLETKKVISGAIYAECDKEGNVIKGTEFNMPQSGWTKLQAGMYYREVKAPDGYLLDPSVYQVGGSEGQPGFPGIGEPGTAGPPGPAQQLFNVTTGEYTYNAFYDIRANSFGVVKKDADDGTVLKGVSFLLSNNATSIEETTDADGVAMFYDIPEGTYTLTETKPLTSYCDPDESWKVTVVGNKIMVADKNGSTLTSENGDYGLPEYTIENTKIKGTPVKIKKISAETGRSIKGAVFHVSGQGKDNNNKDISIDQDYETDDRGYISLNAPYNGTLTIREISNPGYIVDGQSYTVTTVNGNIDSIQSSNGLYSRDGNEIVIQNELSRTFNIRKVDSITGKTIFDKKVTFYAYGQDSVTGSKYSQRVTSDTGTVSFAITGEHDGEYYIREVAAPGGYILDSDRFQLVVHDGKYTFTDSDGNEMKPETDENGVTVYKIANTPVQNQVRIYKMDGESHKPLAGAEFILSGTSDNGVRYHISTITDLKGEASFENICSGTFTLHEEKAPDGYKKAEDIIFTLSDDGTISIDGKKVSDNVITVSDNKSEKHHDTPNSDGGQNDNTSPRDGKTSSGTPAGTSMNSPDDNKNVTIKFTETQSGKLPSEQTEESNSRAVKTGDASSMLLNLLLMCISSMILIAVIISRHERRKA